MKIILRDDIDTLGKCGEVVKVKDGYARNYLIPRKLAIPATVGNLRSINEVNRQKDVRDRKRLRGAEKLKLALEKLSLTAEVQVGEEDRIFGSVTNAQIAELLKQQNFLVDRRDILLEEPIRALGVFTVDIKLEREVVANVKVWVVKKGEKGQLS